MNEANLSTFPSDRLEALAMLYVQAQDLTGRSPADLERMYWEAYAEIRHKHVEMRQSGELSKILKG